jgi:hypothetical protein
MDWNSTFGPTLARAACVACTAGICLAFAGCASVRGIPLQFEIANAGVLADPSAPTLVIEGASNDPSPAAVGAAAGLGVGVAGGSLACVATGPYFPLCMLALVPTSIGVGALGGATIGATMSSPPAPPDPQQQMLRSQGMASPYSVALARHVQREVRATLGVSLPLVDAPGGAGPEGDGSPGPARGWLVVVSVWQLGAVRTLSDQPYPVRVVALLSLRRPRDAQPSFQAVHAATTDATLTTAQWQAEGARAFRCAVDATLARLALDIVNDLSGEPGAPRPPPLPRLPS